MVQTGPKTSIERWRRADLWLDKKKPETPNVGTEQDRQPEMELKEQRDTTAVELDFGVINLKRESYHQRA
jgi:hypothetical protein